MGQELKNLDFAAWRQYIFNHPVGEEPWYVDDDNDWWDEEADPATTVAYVTQLFETAADLPEHYSIEQIARGLTFVVEPAFSGHLAALLDESVIWDERKRGLESMATLFADLFQPHCEPALAHQSPGQSTPLNDICYMWWNRVPFRGRPDDPARDDFDLTCLAVMENILTLDNVACQEAALHGLGLWHDDYPGHVARIVDEFLEGQRNLDPDLHYYARRARRGELL